MFPCQNGRPQNEAYIESYRRSRSCAFVTSFRDSIPNSYLDYESLSYLDTKSQTWKNSSTELALHGINNGIEPQKHTGSILRI